MYKRSLVFLALIVISVWALPVLGQVDVATATLKGTVTDQQGSVVPGATITATSIDRGTSKTAKTDGDGAYRIPLLQPGAYQVQIEAQGFGKAVAESVGLTVGQSLVYDVQLAAGGVSAQVSVTADAPLIQVEQTQQANTINQAQVENLPNINRNMTAAVFTLPGVGDSAATRSQQPGFTGFQTTGFSIGGSNGRNNLSTIDGGENEYGSGQYRVFIPVDAIQEYQVNRSSFAAEFGFTVGSSVNIVTKSGTNKFHGSAYGYFRDNRTQANNFIDQLKFGKELYSQNVIAGGTVGGPIKKDKIFFFTSYEFLKSDAGAFNFLLNSPAALGINGGTATATAQQTYVNALANSGIPAQVAAAATLRTLLVPQNDPNMLKFLNRDDGAYNSLTKAHTLLSRIDYQPNSNNSWNFRFEHARGLFGAESYPDGNSLDTRDYSILTNWAHTFSPSVVNQLRVQIVPFNRANNIPNVDKGSIADPSVANITPSAITIAGFAIGGFVPSFTFGHAAAIPYLAHQKRFQFEDTVAWTKGSHNFKFGGSYRPVSYHVEDDLYFAGQYNFADGTYPLTFALTAAQRAGLPAAPTAANLSGAQSFVAGLTSFVHSGFNNPKWHGVAHYAGFFAQDSWKVSPRLTLDFGGRFDVDAEPPPLQYHSYFSPRLGFAWTPFGDQKTVIRGGGGVFTGPVDVLIPSYTALLDDSGQYINQIFPLGFQSAAIYQAGRAAGLLPFGHLSEAFLNGLRNIGINQVPAGTPGFVFFPTGVATGQGNPNRVVFRADPDYKNPYSIQASLSIQRELVNNVSLEVGYLMYHGLNLQMPVEINLRETGVVDPFLGPIYTRIDPTKLQNLGYDSRGQSLYHGMTVSLNKRYSNGLQFGANYTFSKTLDNVIDFSSSQAWFRPSRLNLFRGISVFDFPHVFAAHAVYNSPFKAGAGHNFLSKALADITIAPVLTLRSGIPFSIRIPSLTNVVTAAGVPTTATNAIFAGPFAASRNSSRGDNYKTLDLLIRKSVFISRDRGLRVDISATGTNILNRINFNKVWDEFSSPYPANGFAGAPTANPVVTLANGSTVNLLTGPYNVKGFKPTSSAQLAGTPGAFVGVDNPRRIQFGLRLAF